MFNDTSKTAIIIWFLLVLHWAMDVIYDFYYIYGPVEDQKKPNDFCCFRCVLEQWALTVIKLLRFFVLMLVLYFGIRIFINPFTVTNGTK